MANRIDILQGVILGTAVGDSLGLPRENLSATRADRLFGGSPLRQHWVLGRGMVSDDSEHTIFVAQSLLAHPNDPDRFARSLAWRLRGWFLTIPAGIGFATLRACIKLWLGFSPGRSGVWSAGNGPAMRAALLGVMLGDDRGKLRAFIRSSTRLTHTDPLAERGAYLIALAAHYGATAGDRDTFLTEAGKIFSEDPEWSRIGTALREHREKGRSIFNLASHLGLSRGVSGYIGHTVAVCLYSWLCHGNDFRRCVEDVILLGGDTDTTGAIAGALAGATVGASAIPPEWLRLAEWPRSMKWMRGLAEQLDKPPGEGKSLAVFWPGIFLRNLVFVGVLMLHLFRRFLPPY